MAHQTLFNFLTAGGAIGAALFTGWYAISTQKLLKAARKQLRVSEETGRQARATAEQTMAAAQDDAKQARDLSVLTDVLREWRDQSFQDDRRFIEALDLELYDLSKDPAFPPEVWKRIWPVMHFCDNVGLLLYHNLVTEQPVLGFVGRPALAAWDKLRPFVYHVRQRGIPDYMGYFHHFVYLAAPRWQWPTQIEPSPLPKGPLGQPTAQAGALQRPMI
jgi:hypothetical protein